MTLKFLATATLAVGLLASPAINGTAQAQTTGTATTPQATDANSCSKMRQSVGTYLKLASMSFKESERLKAAGNKAGQEDAFRKAMVLSELAENYSTVYATFCKK